MLIVTEILIGGGSTKTSSTLSINNPSVVIVLSYSTALLTSVAILITNEYVRKLKLRYTKLGDWINFITSVYEKTLNQSIVDEKIDEKRGIGIEENIRSLPK